MRHHKPRFRAIYILGIPMIAVSCLGAAAALILVGQPTAAMPLLVAGVGFLSLVPTMVIWLTTPKEMAIVAKQVNMKADSLMDKCRKMLGL